MGKNHIFFNFCKLKIKIKKNCITKVFTTFAQYFVDAPLAAFTASSLFNYDATSLAHLPTYLAHSSAAPLKLHQVGWEASVHRYISELS